MNSTEIAGYPKAKKEVRLPTLYYIKINSKWITDLCVRTESIRFLEEKSQVTRKKKKKINWTLNKLRILCFQDNSCNKIKYLEIIYLIRGLFLQRTYTIV